MYRPIVGDIATTDNPSNNIQQYRNQFNNQFRGDNVKSGNITYQDETIAPDYPLPDTKIQNHVVIINSIDRNWYNYRAETPYNYLVKLGGVGSTINSMGDMYSTVFRTYKNVISFSIDKIILPNRPCIQSYNSNISPRINDYPYIAINIEGINYSSYGTNKTLNNTVGVYTPLIPLPTALSDITYLEFKNTSIQRKEYAPSPEGYISRLNISITTPSGNPISNINDVLDIYSIFLSPPHINGSTVFTTDDSLTIQTNTFFYDVEFKKNDLIKVNNYEYHNMSFDESGIFNTWINRNEGHNILDIGKSNPTTSLYNQIKIPIPATLSTTTGNISVTTWFSDFVFKSLSNTAIQDSSGKLINVNTQSHLVVNIKTLEKNDNIFLKEFKP
jgi:hypothetical protein